MLLIHQILRSLSQESRQLARFLIVGALTLEPALTASPSIFAITAASPSAAIFTGILTPSGVRATLPSARPSANSAAPLPIFFVIVHALPNKSLSCTTCATSPIPLFATCEQGQGLQEDENLPQPFAREDKPSRL